MVKLLWIVSAIGWLALGLIDASGRLRADGPADNQPAQVRPVPPPGVKLEAAVQANLRSEIAGLQQRLADVNGRLVIDELRHGLCAALPRAVLMTLETQMFYNEREIEGAWQLLQLADQRVKALAENASAWQLLLGESQLTEPLAEPRVVVGGFHSKIDNSVQPYALVLPRGWSPESSQPLRLDVWLHGRGEKVSEALFLTQRLKQLGEYTPDNTVVLHPYGRYCNAFKFAGEIDVLEAISHVQKLMPIDDGRIVIRGFSMGGAGCWQLAVHYPNLWAAANPGAGFSETTEFLKVFQGEQIRPTDYQQRLLHWYDCPDWTNNLRQVPTIAYSGEKDRQKQAADVMAAAFAKRGMELTHIIGPDTEHKIHAASKLEIEQRLKAAVELVKPKIPRTIDFTTYTLRYHQLGWLAIEGLVKHWQESRVQARWLEPDARIELNTSGVTRLRLQFPTAAGSPTKPLEEIDIDGQRLLVAQVWPVAQQPLYLERQPQGPWQIAHADSATNWASLRKCPGSQGPIDDAFMDRFVMIGPSSATNSHPVDDWSKQEFARAAVEWQRHFRGDAPIVEVTEASKLDPRQNVVLFGTPWTNPVLAEIIKSLPIEWNQQQLVVNGQSYPAATHAPLMIYPSPLDPSHYVVINSGFTYREYAYLNNARQVPMLPDWGVVDVSSGANSQDPGKVLAADFFDERWQFAK